VRKPSIVFMRGNTLMVYANDDTWWSWDREWVKMDIAPMPQPEPVKKPPAVVEPATLNVVEFLTFWDVYQHKVARSNAEKAWDKLCIGDKQKAMAAVSAYVNRTTTDPHDGTRRPMRAHAATWLNAKRWEDECVPAGAPLACYEDDGEDVL
jgi:hypothetical protein